MIAVTIGDPSGIGPEITLKALSALSSQRNNLLLIGNKKLLENLQRKFVGQGFPASSKRERGESLTKYSVIDAFDYFKYNFSKPDKKCGTASFLQLHLASYLLKIGQIKGIVTAPVSKTALTIAGFPYAGQTEYFATEFGIKKYGMLAWSEQVKIILVTIHKPLKDVPKLITSEKVLEKIILLNNYLKTYEKIKRPRIGVFSLNPHAFEFTCGAEDKILKAINQSRKLGISCDGPLPADSAFSSFIGQGLSLASKHNGSRRLQPANELILKVATTKYNGYVAMYHDQGMLPVKLSSAGAGVNMTLGLPFIRTSPLHGVAFDIAGKGIANPNAMINAIQLCQKLTRTK